MRRIIIIFTVVVLLVTGSAGESVAQGNPQNDRACVGAFASTLARDPAYHPLGQNVSSEARDEQLHPYGRTTLAPFATSCELPDG